MKAFISYSHKDSAMLNRLHTHLAQLTRDGQLNAWTDEAIQAGEKLTSTISRNLDSSQLFLALLSPDYIASRYCYEKEFEHAQELVKAGQLIIVPIILEPCDWIETPFSEFKALPKDGKPISEWSNANTAFLDVIQNLRKLLQSAQSDTGFISVVNSKNTVVPTRNYKVKKDFDSIQKIEFAESAFIEIREKLESYLKELIHVDSNIKYRIVTNDPRVFEAILVNRNKTNAESTIKILNDSEMRVRSQLSNYNTRIGKQDIAYTLGSEHNNQAKGFEMSSDEYHLFWIESSLFGGNRNQKELSSKDMAESIWSDWIESVGIM